MKVNINSVHFKADKKLEEFIEGKLAKLTEYFDGILGSDVTLKLDNTEGPENKIAEIRVLVPGSDLYAKKQSKSFEEATDLAAEALRRQLIKFKGRLKSK